MAVVKTQNAQALRGGAKQHAFLDKDIIGLDVSIAAATNVHHAKQSWAIAEQFLRVCMPPLDGPHKEDAVACTAYSQNAASSRLAWDAEILCAYILCILAISKTPSTCTANLLVGLSSVCHRQGSLDAFLDLIRTCMTASLNVLFTCVSAASACTLSPQQCRMILVSTSGGTSFIVTASALDKSLLTVKMPEQIKV